MGEPRSIGGEPVRPPGGALPSKPVPARQSAPSGQSKSLPPVSHGGPFAQVQVPKYALLTVTGLPSGSKTTFPLAAPNGGGKRRPRNASSKVEQTPLGHSALRAWKS